MIHPYLYLGALSVLALLSLLSVRPVPIFIPLGVAALFITQLALSLTNRRLALLALGFLLPLAPMFRQGALAFVLIAFCFGSILRRNISYRVSPLELLFLLGFSVCYLPAAILGIYLGWDSYLLSSFASTSGLSDYYHFNLVNTERVFDILQILNGLFLSVFVYFSLSNEREWELILKGLAWGFIPASLIILAQVLGFPSILSFNLDPFFQSQGRVPGSLSDPNALGVFAGIFGPLIFLRSLERREYFLSVVSICFIALATFSGSRTLFVAIAAWVIVRARWRQRGLCLLVGLLAILTLSQFEGLNQKLRGLSPSLSFQRVLSTISSAEYERMLESRFVYSKIALSSIKESPVAGLGLQGFYEAQADIAESLGIELSGWLDNANNFYLQVLSEGGVISFVGLVVCLAAVLLALKNGAYISLLSRQALVVIAVALLTGPHLFFDELKMGLVLILFPIFHSSRQGGETPLFPPALIVCSFIVLSLLLGPEKSREAQGFYQVEGEEAWTAKSFQIPLCDDSQLDFVFRFAHPGIDKTPVEVRAKLFSGQDELLKTFTFSADHARWRKFVLPEAKERRLEMSLSRTWSPFNEGLAMDARQLGTRVRIPQEACEL